jgi:hypothetical protein
MAQLSSCQFSLPKIASAAPSVSIQQLIQIAPTLKSSSRYVQPPVAHYAYIDLLSLQAGRRILLVGTPASRTPNYLPSTASGKCVSSYTLSKRREKACLLVFVLELTAERRGRADHDFICIRCHLVEQAASTRCCKTENVLREVRGVKVDRKGKEEEEHRPR